MFRNTQYCQDISSFESISSIQSHNMDINELNIKYIWTTKKSKIGNTIDREEQS